MSITLEEGFKKYGIAKLGEPPRRVPLMTNDTERAINAADYISGQYDLGIEIVSDGLWLGYMCNLFGLPTKAVRMQRRGRGASWQTLEKIAEKDVRNKRLVLFDLDAVTGRTIKRAVRELKEFSPERIDALFMRDCTLLSPKRYQKLKGYGIPGVPDIYSHLDVKNWEFTDNGLTLKYIHQEDCKTYEFLKRTGHDDDARHLLSTLEISKKDFFGFDFRPVVSGMVDNVMTLPDFNNAISTDNQNKLEEALKRYG